MSVKLAQNYMGSSNLVVGSKITVALNVDITENNTLYDIVVKSPLSHQLSFVPQSIKINGALAPAEVVNTSIPVVDEIVGPANYLITFEAIIVDDTPNIFSFSSTVEFMPLSPLKKQTVYSNESTIRIMYSEIYVNGQVEFGGYYEDKVASQVLLLETEPTLELLLNDYNMKTSEEYAIQFTVTNISDLALSNLLLDVKLPSNIKMVDNSLYINEIKSSLVVIPNPIPIDTMQPGEQVYVRFLVTPVDDTNITGKISGELSYDYFVNGISYTGTVETDEETVYIYDFNLTLTQNINKEYFEILETGKFTIVAKNTGNNKISDLIIRDIVSNKVTIDPESIRLNDEPVENPNLYFGINVGELATGESATITFDALVDGGDIHPITVPNIVYGDYKVFAEDNIHYMSGNAEADTLFYTIYSMNVKQTIYRIPNNLSQVRVLDTVPYGVCIKNMGNVVLEDMVVKSVFSSNLEFIPDTVYVNDVPITGSIIDGITITKLNLQETVTIAYSGKVTKYLDDSVTPKLPQVTSKVTSEYKGMVFENEFTETVTTGPIVSTVETVNIVITQFDGKPSIIGNKEILTYTVELTNTGITDGTDVKFKTNDNVMFEFVEGSVVLVESGGVETKTDFGDPKNGWTIPLIKAGESVKYSYKVLVL